jgi:4-hydroxy-3-methylbut-2-en-1-yl diphosphate reductase
MKLLRAESMGFCFGVRDAVQLAQRASVGGPVAVLGDLVHNPAVMAELDRVGVRVVQHPSEAGVARLMYTAHGVSNAKRRLVESEGVIAIDATCPLVRRAHEALSDLVARGFHPVVIGVRNHVEVRGLTEDWPETEVLLEPEDVDRVAAKPKFGVVAQTTQPPARVGSLIAALQARFPDAEVEAVDTVCHPTKSRQTAARRLAAKCSVVVVLGGAKSNNTRELAAVCRESCRRVHQAAGVEDLDPAWFHPDDTVGVTAGASTPESTVVAVEQWLKRLDATRPDPTPACAEAA